MSLPKPRQTKHQMKTLEDWHRGIRDVRDPLDLTVFLISSRKDWDFKSKVQVLLLLPKEAIRDYTGMNLLETRLEDADQPQLAQIVRWLCFQNLTWSSRISEHIWCYMKMAKDDFLNEMVQRSTFIKEELQTLQAPLKSLQKNTNNSTEEVIDRRNQINRYKTELQRVEEAYQGADHILRRLEGEIPVGVVGRAFKSFRKNPKWHLSPKICQECADKGGCCGRACRCCEKDCGISLRKGKRGHCSDSCGCCLRTHGKQYKGLDEENVSTTQEWWSMISFCLSIFTGSIGIDRKCRVYIWGLDYIDELGLL